MSTTILRLSPFADDFPDLEVSYSDLIGLEYRAGARGPLLWDCLGIALEIYRRAGIGLPDPAGTGNSVAEFRSLFRVLDPTESRRLYDLVLIRRRSLDHVAIVVRHGTTLTSAERLGVHELSFPLLRQLSSVETYRLRNEVLASI